MRGQTGRSRWGSELHHIVPARGGGWGAIISATGGVHSGVQQCTTDGGGLAHGRRAIGNHGKTGYRGGVQLGPVWSVFVLFFFFSEVLVMNQGIEVGTSGGRVHMWRPGLRSL